MLFPQRAYFYLFGCFLLPHCLPPNLFFAQGHSATGVSRYDFGACLPGHWQPRVWVGLDENLDAMGRPMCALPGHHQVSVLLVSPYVHAFTQSQAKFGAVAQGLAIDGILWQANMYSLRRWPYFCVPGVHQRSLLMVGLDCQDDTPSIGHRAAKCLLPRGRAPSCSW